MEILRQSSSTRENLGLLAVMEALEKEERITQRELAKVTGLNLKKVNYCLNKLMEKGHVKFQRARRNPDKRAYLYILTPAGLRAKSQLTYRFLKFTLDFYNRMEGKMHQCLDEMLRVGTRNLVLYGVSDVARIFMGIADERQVNITAVIDENGAWQEFFGLPVFAPDRVSTLVWDRILITSLDNIEEVEQDLLGLGVSEESIWRLS